MTFHKQSNGQIIRYSIRMSLDELKYFNPTKEEQEFLDSIDEESTVSDRIKKLAFICESVERERIKRYENEL